MAEALNTGYGVVNAIPVYIISAILVIEGMQSTYVLKISENVRPFECVQYRSKLCCVILDQTKH